MFCLLCRQFIMRTLPCFHVCHRCAHGRYFGNALLLELASPHFLLQLPLAVSIRKAVALLRRQTFLAMIRKIAQATLDRENPGTRASDMVGHRQSCPGTDSRGPARTPARDSHATP
eukprot:5388036-Pyramimonas_sp.AAC.1